MVRSFKISTQYASVILALLGVFSIFFVGFGGIPSSLAGEAIVDTILEIPDMPVTSEDAQPEKARKDALAAGQKAAFSQLLHNIITEEDFEALPLFTQEEIDSVTAGMLVDRESNKLLDKTKRNQFRARVTYQFRKQEIEKLLDGYDIILKEYHQPTIMIIPLFNLDGEYILWEGENPWQDAWNQLLSINKKAFIVVPLGDYDDIKKISIDDVLAGDITIFKELAARYDAKNIIIAEAQLKGDVLKVNLEPLGESKIPAEQMIYTMGKDTEISGFMGEVVDDLMQRIDDFRRAMRAESEHKELLEIVVPSSDSRQLARIVEKMKALKLVLSLEIKEVSPTRFVIRIEHKEELNTMLAYLDTNGFPIAQIGGNYVITADDSDEQKRQGTSN